MTNIDEQPTLISTDAVLAVPSRVQLCPYCGASLVVQFSSWTQDDDDGTWLADSVELDCVNTPELDEDNPGSLAAWDEHHQQHSQYPYVYWLPATLTVQKWVNKNFRFRMDDDIEKPTPFWLAEI